MEHKVSVTPMGTQKSNILSLRLCNFVQPSGKCLAEIEALSYNIILTNKDGPKFTGCAVFESPSDVNGKSHYSSANACFDKSGFHITVASSFGFNSRQATFLHMLERSPPPCIACKFCTGLREHYGPI